MGNKIDRVMRYSEIAFVGNPYLQNRAEKAGARRVYQVPTVINTEVYGKKSFEKKDRITIGWIGSPSTLKYVKMIIPALEKLNREFDIELMLVNGERGVVFSGKQVLVRWSEETEVSAIQQMDIGIMPLPDDKWERGKCAYKLIQYMACALPLVASPVGMNIEVVTHGENGFLAETEEEWVESLSMLIRDAGLRKQMGEKGFALVQEKYTVEKNFELMKGVLGMMDDR
jgi:glycosyltransferase involved in cell wall biosynthesis